MRNGRGAFAPRAVATRLRRSAVGQVVFGSLEGQQWLRVEMDRALGSFLATLDTSSLDALEISGNQHRGRGWKSYRDAWYPDFDILQPPALGQFDVVLCEQVLEHVGGDPWLALRNLSEICRPGGYLVATTPFLVCIHGKDSDFWRFTPDGMARMVEGAGMEIVQSGSWGNLWCVYANRRAQWAPYRPWHRLLRRWSLRNDPLNPQQVWVVARRPAA